MCCITHIACYITFQVLFVVSKNSDVYMVYVYCSLVYVVYRGNCSHPNMLFTNFLMLF